MTIPKKDRADLLECEKLVELRKATDAAIDIVKARTSVAPYDPVNWKQLY